MQQKTACFVFTRVFPVTVFLDLIGPFVMYHFSEKLDNKELIENESLINVSIKTSHREIYCFFETFSRIAYLAMQGFGTKLFISISEFFFSWGDNSNKSYVSMHSYANEVIKCDH